MIPSNEIVKLLEILLAFTKADLSVRPLWVLLYLDHHLLLIVPLEFLRGAPPIISPSCLLTLIRALKQVQRLDVRPIPLIPACGGRENLCETAASLVDTMSSRSVGATEDPVKKKSSPISLSDFSFSFILRLCPSFYRRQVRLITPSLISLNNLI